MKKFLSLVLALVMTMSLVTISAGAEDFTDADDIQYIEAVDVMTEVGIVTGYTDGAFKPGTALNRGQAAKIICNMILGPTEAGALATVEAPFKDVPADHVFSGYIAYCVSEGIVSGYTDGTFKPGNTLTGYAFWKMLLTALGYDADAEGYNSTNFAVNVAKRGLAIGLDDGKIGDFKGNQTVTREEALLYAFNAMQATMVEYEDASSVTIGDIVITNNSVAKEVENNKTKDNTIDNDGKMQFAEKYFPKLKISGTGSDDFGRPATEWTYKNDVIGVYSDVDDLVGEYTKKVTQGALYSLVGKGVYDNIVDAKEDAVLNVYVDGKHVVVNEKNEDNVLPYLQKNSTDACGKDTAGEAKNGVLTEVYLDSDGNVTIVIAHTWIFQVAADYSAKKETVKIVAAGDTAILLDSYTLSADDFEGIEVLKEDDYLLVTATVDGAKYEVQSIESAEMVTGVVNSYKQDKSVTIDGDPIEYSATTSAEANGVADTQYTVGQAATLVLDAYGYVIAIEETLVSSNYVYIAAIDRVVAGLVGSAARADAYFVDGTEAEIIIDKVISGTTTIDNAATIASATYDYKWYTYGKTADGEYILLDIESKYTPVDVMYTANNTQIMFSDKVDFMPADNSSPAKTPAPANDITTVIVRDDDGEADAYTGLKAIPDITTNTADAAVYTLKNNKTGYTAFAFVNGYQKDLSVVGGEEDDSFVYVVKYDGQFYVDENNTYFTYKVLNDEGKEDTVKFDYNSMNTTSTGVYDLYYKTRTDSDGIVTSMPVVTTGGKYFNKTFDGAVTYEDGVLVLGDGGSYTVAADAEIVVITKKASGLNKDPDAAYEATMDATPAGLAGSLKGVTVDDAKMAGAFTENNGSKIQTLYITIDDAAITGGTSDPDTTEVATDDRYDRFYAAAGIEFASEEEGELTVSYDYLDMAALVNDPLYAGIVNQLKGSAAESMDGSLFFGVTFAIPEGATEFNYKIDGTNGDSTGDQTIDDTNTHWDAEAGVVHKYFSFADADGNGGWIVNADDVEWTVTFSWDDGEEQTLVVTREVNV